MARAALQEHPEAVLFVCGPPLNTGRLLSQYPDQRITRIIMQGGFVGPRVHGLPCIRMPEMENAFSLPCYNLNGDPANARVLLHAEVGERRLVGRNVCHAIVYTLERHASRPRWPQQHPAVQLFNAAIEPILSRRPEKKIHDVVAVMAHFYPDLFTWVRGRPFTRLTRDGRRLWGTRINPEGDHIAINLDIDRFRALFLAPPVTSSAVSRPFCAAAA